MRFALTTVLVAGLLLTATPASAVHRPCNYPHTVRGNKMTVSCFAKRMNVGPDGARAIANRESSFNEFAWNDSSGAAGLYQHLIKYWSSRVWHYRRALNKFHVKHRSWHNPRAQAVVTFKMVKAQGGWCPAWC